MPKFVRRNQDSPAVIRVTLVRRREGGGPALGLLCSWLRSPQAVRLLPVQTSAAASPPAPLHTHPHPPTNRPRPRPCPRPAQWNTGPEAYRRAELGPQLTVVRRIEPTGGGGFELLDCEGRVVGWF